MNPDMENMRMTILLADYRATTDDMGRRANAQHACLGFGSLMLVGLATLMLLARTLEEREVGIAVMASLYSVVTGILVMRQDMCILSCLRRLKNRIIPELECLGGKGVIETPGQIDSVSRVVLGWWTFVQVLPHLLVMLFAAGTTALAIWAAQVPTYSDEDTRPSAGLIPISAIVFVAYLIACILLATKYYRLGQTKSVRDLESS